MNDISSINQCEASQLKQDTEYQGTYSESLITLELTFFYYIFMHNQIFI